MLRLGADLGVTRVSPIRHQHGHFSEACLRVRAVHTLIDLHVPRRLTSQSELLLLLFLDLRVRLRLDLLLGGVVSSLHVVDARISRPTSHELVVSRGHLLGNHCRRLLAIYAGANRLQDSSLINCEVTGVRVNMREVGIKSRLLQDRRSSRNECLAR